MIAQKIRKVFSQMEVAMSYYAIICTINKIPITDRQLQLLSFTAIKGSITNPATRQEFCSLYTTSQATISNMVGQLKRKGLLSKVEGKMKVTPAIALDFQQPIILQLTLHNG